MIELIVSVKDKHRDDWFVLYLKKAPDEARSCAPKECSSLEDWTPVKLNTKNEGSYNASVGKYYYLYQAGGKSGNEFTIRFAHDGKEVLKRRIKIDKNGESVGCHVFRVSGAEE